MYPYENYYLDPYEYGYRQIPPVAPPFGLPGGGGFFPPGGGPGGPAGGPPSGPPPSFTPSQSQAQGGVGIQAVDPGSLFACRFRFVYIWLDNGRSFWVYLTFVGRRSIAGYRWTRRRGWVYFGIDTRRIDSFICY